MYIYDVLAFAASLFGPFRHLPTATDLVYASILHLAISPILSTRTTIQTLSLTSTT
jgi:hypothetical protein